VPRLVDPKLGRGFGFSSTLPSIPASSAKSGVKERKNALKNEKIRSVLTATDLRGKKGVGEIKKEMD
jgi:hypothetical protein